MAKLHGIRVSSTRNECKSLIGIEKSPPPHELEAQIYRLQISCLNVRFSSMLKNNARAADDRFPPIALFSSQGAVRGEAGGGRGGTRGAHGGSHPRRRWIVLVTRSAAASRKWPSRWTYCSVEAVDRWPRSLPVTARLSPDMSDMLAKVWRRSWRRRRGGSSARAFSLVQS